MLCGWSCALSCRPNAVAPRACSTLNVRFDLLVSERRVRDAVDVMEAESLELMADRVSALLDTACAVSTATARALTPPGGAPPNKATVELQSRQQEELLSVYAALARRGSLRGFGSIAATGLLPLSLGVRTVTPEDQLRLTGLATSAFAPPSAGSASEIAAGTVSALLLSALSEALALDGRLVFGAAAVALVADQLLLGGVVAELASRAVRPGYGKTVREHEAGHFLIAYLLGLPVEACVLDVWAAARDGRFAGAAGTVFLDPALGRAQASGTVTREIIDRYSVVVMGGIAAEAAQNGKAEGGQADEAALVELLGSLGGGAAWDGERVRNQARWASSQARTCA